MDMEIHGDVVMSNMEYRYVLETTYWTDQLMRIYMVIVIIYILITNRVLVLGPEIIIGFLICEL